VIGRYSTYRGNKKGIWNFSQKTEGKKLFVKPRHRGEEDCNWQE
jgi:hypothetical protein